MLSSERRGSSARRGMTVLGKIPAVPKPINLPSQRLENRGLDPNVEIVPRGSVSWGSAGRSPPTSVNAWGTPSQASSPPSSSGAWGPKAGAGPVGSNSDVSGGSAVGGPGSIPRPTSGGSGTRPSSGGAGTRPLSAESQAQQSPDSVSSGAWGARPSSASGVLGQAQPQLAQAQGQARPRSADITRPNRSLSEFGDQSGSHSPPGNAAWGNRGPPRRLGWLAVVQGEEPHQVSRFQLTRTDFPTLGSEKNPDLRPQHSNPGGDRGASVETKGAHPEERRPPTPPGPHEEIPPMPPGGGYGHLERGAPDNWRREPAAFQGPPPAAEGNWHRDGPAARPSYGGQGPQPDSWRREAAPSGGPADNNWWRGGAPPVGQYGPPPGPGHYPHEGPGFMHQPRFGPGPAPFGRGAPGPGGYGHHGDMYGNDHKEGSEGPGHKDGRGYNERYSGGAGPGQEGDNRRGGLHRAAPSGGDGHGQGQEQRGSSSGHHGGHRDWGAAASSDEPMDFSKPVFEEEVVSASPDGSGKQSPSPGQRDEVSVEEVKREDVKADANSEKSVVEVETVKDEEKKVVVASKSDPVAPQRGAEVSSTPTSRSKGGDVAEGKEQTERKMQNVVDKEVVAKIVTKDGPGKWERGSKRADGHTREVIGPAASGAPTASLRSGQYNTKSSILGNAPRNVFPMASQSGYIDAGPGISSELRARDLPSKRLLGKGLVSIGYETEWKGERFARKDFVGVPSGTFRNEAAVLVGVKDHRNVVKTHGWTVDKMSCSLVLEYMEDDLLDLLLKRKESQGSQSELSRAQPFELPEALDILLQISKGMEYLHEQEILHGDLKTKNILVSVEDGDKHLLSVKVSDFGLVRTKRKSMSFVSRSARKLDVVQWKAPEILEMLLSEDKDETSSESDGECAGSPGVTDELLLSADVYSFAVTCVQVLTGEDPYPNLKWKEMGAKIVSSELRPKVPAACPSLLKDLLVSCWGQAPAQRPSFSSIRATLEHLQNPQTELLRDQMLHVHKVELTGEGLTALSLRQDTPREGGITACLKTTNLLADNLVPQPTQPSIDKGRSKSPVSPEGSLCSDASSDAGLDDADYVSSRTASRLKRKMGKKTTVKKDKFEFTKLVKPRYTIQTRSDVEIVDDGYKWRKYGQKSVRNSPHPRNYYICTQRDCPVTKQVERPLDDPGLLITTYGGTHNHPSTAVAPAKDSSRASENSSGAPPSQDHRSPPAYFSFESIPRFDLKSSLTSSFQGQKDIEVGTNWKQAEVLQLIQLRGEMDSRFAHSTRRAALWDELAERFLGQGIKRDGKQCREKWDQLMAECKDVTDGKHDQWESRYYTELTAILDRPVEAA